MAERFDTEDRDWPMRPWIMAAIGALGGLIVYVLTDSHHYDAPFPVWRQAATAFTAIATVSFLLTVELRRWTWSIAFALGWGAVIALVGWFTAQYNHVPEIFEFPFFSGILAVLIAAPLFQTVRDEGAWRFPYARLHRHAWTDAVIGAASLAFTGVTFLLAWLIAGLFNVIGIDAIKELLQEEWFGWMLAGFAFGGALGMLRERDALAATLQKLVMVVLGVLAPVLATALAAFLISLPFKGLAGLWDSDIPATPLLLVSGAGAVLLANAVIGNGEDDRSNIWLRRSALVLVLCILPLAILAAVSMGQRINQYGWTPERIWGVVAVAVAIAYGAMGWWSTFKGRAAFDAQLRPLQTKLAIGLCGLAVFLALPILDFGAISARSQIARLETGKVKAEEFDWTAMAFDFGKAGRRYLAEVEKNGPAPQRALAKTALAATSRYTVFEEVKNTATAADLDRRMRVLPEGATVDPKLREAVSKDATCSDKSCALVLVSPTEALLVGHPYSTDRMVKTRLVAQTTGEWMEVSDGLEAWPDNKADPQKAPVEVRTVTRRQLFVDGKPVGQPFE